MQHVPTTSVWEEVFCLECVLMEQQKEHPQHRSNFKQKIWKSYLYRPYRAKVFLEMNKVSWLKLKKISLSWNSGEKELQEISGLNSCSKESQPLDQTGFLGDFFQHDLKHVQSQRLHNLFSGWLSSSWKSVFTSSLDFPCLSLYLLSVILSPSTTMKKLHLYI